MSKSQNHILDILKKHHGPIDVASLLEKVRAHMPTINKTTIYRALEKLLSEKQISEVHLKNRKIFYEIMGDHHHHLVCTSCDRIEEIHLPHHLEEIEKDLEQQTGYEISSHQLDFFGICSTCKN